jgi:5,10-methylene-tetrahydrofolate dehydrogenase/methenyl tetrahydrofolate cyclohydrolase
LTRDISIHTKRADILIVAVGKPKLITADMVKEGVVVIDVGVNRIHAHAEHGEGGEIGRWPGLVKEAVDGL